METNFTRKSISQYILYDTPVENIFISEYMTKAPESCVKAYLLGLMYANMGQPADDDLIAKSLGLTPSELQDCWRYWEDEGLLERRMGSQGTELQFVSLREQAFGIPAAKEEETRTPVLGSEEAARLYSSIEAVTGSLLSPQEIEEIGAWITSYGMKPEFIMAGYNYSKSRGRSTNYRYVGKILKDWKAMGISDEEGVREHLAESDRHYDLYRKVFRAMGFKYNPTAEQKRMMDSWTDEMDFSVDRILEACAKTAAISNPNIKYVDSVLRGWYSEEKKDSTKPADQADLLARVRALYERDREENRRKTEELRNRVFTEVPRVSEIMAELKDASYKLSRAMFTGGSGKAAAEGQRQRIKALSEEKARLLREAGFSEDATDMIYTCAKCKDTGELEDGTRCSCFAEKLALVQSGLL
ncbi:MAG: DnaD domain protein [Firmicutes bacterium]|nr:DnaD domain protein [Bacillota bacterium]MBR0440821.1 DnaD domain protein [Bacillota bacterium]